MNRAKTLQNILEPPGLVPKRDRHEHSALEERGVQRRPSTHREVHPGPEVRRRLPGEVRCRLRYPQRLSCMHMDDDRPRTRDVIIDDDWDREEQLPRKSKTAVAVLTEKVDHDPAVRRAAAGVAEEGLAVRRPTDRRLLALDAQHVPRVSERVAEAEYAGVARRLALVVATVVGAAVCLGAGGEEKR